MTYLVVGARPGSLGWHIADGLEQQFHYDVVTAGVSRGDEDEYVDVRSVASVQSLMMKVNPEHVICTAGINLPDTQDLFGEQQMDVNFHGPMRLLAAWLGVASDGHFVAVSSNSAHIARSPSVGYCASKAALSMGIRAAARREGSRMFAPSIYAWEFGLLEGTPMTQASAAGLPEGTALTRMVGLKNGIPVAAAAGHVLRALGRQAPELNGCTLRVDAGEQ